jgi:serine/threonine protein kinase
MKMIGKELAGRYEIVSRIGGGGMALVYKGHDMLLNRAVAIKVLRQQFVHDDEFIHRFRREAQSAASLSHPNVVSIYDVGKEDDIHYIVMEYIEGKTLKDHIQERAPLPSEEAVYIAMQIADALDHAHQNQIIHRDIKPHNILMGKNGRVKVTDFGIARAVTSTTMTYTGSVIGSVHYFSPEHAKGIMTGEKSDIYSLGIVLYEMLTGELPFTGESPISVALKHLQDKVKAPTEVNPNIPQSLENIILRALCKDSNGRYSSAKQMLADLNTCLNSDRIHEPKIIVDEPDDMDRTMVLPAIRQDVMNTLIVNGDDDLNDDEDEPYRGTRKWVKPVVWLIVLITFLSLTFFGMKLVAGMFSVQDVKVPDLVNNHRSEAKMKLDQLKLIPLIKERYDEKIEKDYVIKQGTFHGMTVKEGSSVELFVSLGPETATMKEVIGKMQSEALIELEQIGIKKEQITYKEDFNKNVPAGTIMDQYPRSGEEVIVSKAQIELTVSKGKETIVMPNLIGLKESAVFPTLTKNDLVLGNPHSEPAYNVEPGIVFKQFPYEPGADVSPGESIDIWVSSGYPKEAKVIYDQFNVSSRPDGMNSEIVVIVSDARGDNMEVVRENISKSKDYKIKAVLSPQKNAFIQVHQDGYIVYSNRIDYDTASSN